MNVKSQGQIYISISYEDIKPYFNNIAVLDILRTFEELLNCSSDITNIYAINLNVLC